MDLRQKKKNRFLFLNKVYNEADGSLNAVFDGHEIGEELNFDFNLTSDLIDYLINEGLIEFYGLGGVIRLTHNGIKEIEQAHENPSESTTHFSPINYINIHSTGDGNVINTGNDNVFSISNVINSDVVVKNAQEIIQLLKNDFSVNDAVKTVAIETLNKLISEVENDKPTKQTMEELLTVGSAISSIGSLVISLFQLICTI